MALARTHFFVVFLLFCGIISVAFYYSEFRNHSNNGSSSNTFVGRNKRRTHLFEEGYVNDNSTQESTQYNDTTESCHLNFSVADTENAHSFFTRELQLPKYESIDAVYIYLKKANKTGSKDERSNKWNGLQEWIWVKRESKYHSLKLPVDLDSLTFTISKYGTYTLTISWTLPINCSSLIEDDLIYNNETENIVKYLWSNVVGNRTNTEICHRNFDRDVNILEDIWWITTVWVGYNYDCYPINSLIEGYIENNPSSKYDLSKILPFAVGFLCYMYPFLWYILESIQLNKSTKLHRYYKDAANVHKPYGITRALQKIFFNTWHDTAQRTDFKTKYTPIARYIIFLTIIVLSMNCYKLFNIKNELFEEDSYSNFPDVYRYGVPEYRSFPHWLVLLFSVVIYMISNIWIYIVYNESNDFILCIPKCLRTGTWFIPVRDVLKTEEDNVNNEWILNTSTKLINRFTLLFSVHFWRFIFTYSMCSRCGVQNNDRERSTKKNTTKCRKWCNCFLSIFCHIPFGIFILSLNVIINIIFCSLPALWFVIYIPITVLSNRLPKKPVIFIIQVFLWLCYIFTLRVQVGFHIFIVRSFFYTILIGFTGPPHIWNIYVIVMASLTYFATYFSQFIDSYNVLLETVFDIKAKINSNTQQTVSIDAQNVQTNSNAQQIVTIERNAQTDSNTRQTTSIEDRNTETDLKTTETEGIDERDFNYIVDNCYSDKKRFFLLILKTVLTVVFISVSLLILNITNKIDNNKNITNILPYIMILISPKIVSMFSEGKAKDAIMMYKSEITKLYKNISTNNMEESDVTYTADTWYEEFSSDTHDLCTYLSLKCTNCIRPTPTQNRGFFGQTVGLLIKGLFDWSNITCDHTQLLSLANINNVPQCTCNNCFSSRPSGYIQIVNNTESDVE